MDRELLMYISRQLDAVISILGKRQRKPTRRKGRPTKEHVVMGYRRHHPEASKKSCARVTGLSFKTISKYWDVVKENSVKRKRF